MHTQDQIRLEVPASLKYLNVVGACILQMLTRVDGLTEAEALTYHVQLAVHEACLNIVHHAYDGMENGRIDIVLSLLPNPVRLLVELHDTGKAFDFSAVSEPGLAQGQAHGYGLFLIRQLMDEVTYTPKPGNNSWRLVKRLHAGTQP